MSTFDNTELSILKMFYVLGMEADDIQWRHERDPLDIIARHNALPRDEFDAVMYKVENLKCTDMGLAPPDDPIFSGGVQGFTVRRRGASPEEA
jgi:hypothetical protein